MDEVETVQAVEEVATPQQNPQEMTPETAPADNSREDNLRALRQSKKEAEKRAAEFERQLKIQQEMLAQIVAAKGSTQQTAEKDELDDIPDDDYLDKRNVKKLIEKERVKAREIAQEEARKQWAEQDKQNFHSKLQKKFSDFDEVVTPETLELLEEHDPELAQSIVELQDPYKMGYQSYKFIKSLGLSGQVPDARRAKEVEKKLEQNKKTVTSPLAYDKRPMAKAFEMTDHTKKELYAEMMKYASQL